MITLLKEILAILIIVFIISQIVLPSFIPNLQYFNLFRTKKVKEITELDELDRKVEKTSKEYQEVIKAQAVTEAEQRKKVAELDAETALAEKRANILRGEGEGAYKRAVMAGNGALDQKLATYEKVQKYWADAFSAYQGNLVPTYQTGGGTNTNAGFNFMELMGAKAARDLSLDLSNKK